MSDLKFKSWNDIDLRASKAKVKTPKHTFWKIIDPMGRVGWSIFLLVNLSVKNTLGIFVALQNLGK